MSYIQPNSTIILLSNVPIQPDYSDTLFFETLSEQTDYFLGKTLRRFDAQYYQRHTRNTCRVNCRADDVDMCNYMMFRNTAFQDKWFYAFVTSVEYINVNVAEITYEIDQLQSWFFDYSVLPCFVERMHSATDNIGDNIVPEKINCGEYVANGSFNYLTPDLSEELIICLLFSSLNDDSGSITSNYDDVYSTGNIYMYHNETAGRRALQTFLISKAPQFWGSVMALYMLPKWCLTAAQQNFNDGDIMTDWLITEDRPVATCTISNISSQDTLDGYIPKNKKLYTYPFNFLHVDNCQNTGMNLRYEFFDQSSGYINLIQMGNVLPPITTVLYPVNYKNSQVYYNESVGISNYPQCPVAIDAYTLWFTQNLIPDIIKIAGGSFGGMVGSDITSASAASPLGGVTNLISGGIQSSLQGDVIKGNIQNGNLSTANKRLRYEYVRMSVNAQQARIIDDYFKAFGYAQNKIMMPSRKTRTRFTYLKTKDCSIKGTLPNEALADIQKIYDKGIRFWNDKNPVTVLNMDIDNPPLTPNQN